MKEFIDQNKLTKFEIICLFLMSTFKEDYIKDEMAPGCRFILVSRKT